MDPRCAYRPKLHGKQGDPVFGIRLISGSRHLLLPGLYLWGAGPNISPVPDSYWDWRDHLRDRFFSLPAWDDSWPDSTLLVFEPMYGDAVAPGDAP